MTNHLTIIKYLFYPLILKIINDNKYINIYKYKKKKNVERNSDLTF